MTATASADPAVGVARVEFHNGSTLLGDDSSAPYTFVWQDVPNGTYTVSARTLDGFGFGAFSAPATVVVGSCSSPTITVEPEDSSMPTGGSATLSVTAGGSALDYQWYQGAVGVVSSPIQNGTSSTLMVTPQSSTTYWVRVTNACGVDDSRPATVTVQPASAPTKPNFVATKFGAGVNLSWNASAYATVYVIERKETRVEFRVIATVQSPTTAFFDSTCGPSAACIYRVLALDASCTQASPYSDSDASVSMNLSAVDVGSPVAAAHFDQILAAVNAIRAIAALASVSWTDILPAGVPQPVIGGTIRAAHVTSSRTAVNDALRPNGVPIRTYSALGVGTVVAALHMRELQQAVE